MEYTPNQENTTEKRGFKNISPTAFGHIYFRSFYSIPLASEMADLMEAEKKTSEMYGKVLMVPVMEARYKGGESCIVDFIKENPEAQILELASGFSLHGTNLSLQYPSIEYIETDLPDMVATKIDVLKKLSMARPNLRFASANALDLDALRKLVSDSARPLAIYNEGLMSYLSDDEKNRLATIVRELLKDRVGIWITPDPALSAERRKSIRQILPDSWSQQIKRVEDITKQKYDDYGFKSEADADSFFEQNGFNSEKVPQPTDLNSFTACNLDPQLVEKLKNNIRSGGKVWLSRIRD